VCYRSRSDIERDREGEVIQRIGLHCDVGGAYLVVTKIFQNILRERQKCRLNLFLTEIPTISSIVQQTDLKSSPFDAISKVLVKELSI
jgi:hypothetical protein